MPRLLLLAFDLALLFTRVLCSAQMPMILTTDSESSRPEPEIASTGRAYPPLIDTASTREPDICASFPGVDLFAPEAIVLTTCICRSGIHNFLRNDPGAPGLMSVVGRKLAGEELGRLINEWATRPGGSHCRYPANSTPACTTADTYIPNGPRISCAFTCRDGFMKSELEGKCV